VYSMQDFFFSQTEIEARTIVLNGSKMRGVWEVLKTMGAGVRALQTLSLGIV